MKVSHLAELASIKDFVRMCRKDPLLVGFNVRIDKAPGWSWIFAKTSSGETIDDCLKPKYWMKFNLDYLNPIEKVMVDEAIIEAGLDRKMTGEEGNKSLFCETEDLGGQIGYDK